MANQPICLAQRAVPRPIGVSVPNLSDCLDCFAGRTWTTNGRQSGDTPAQGGNSVHWSSHPDVDSQKTCRQKGRSTLLCGKRFAWFLPFRRPATTGFASQPMGKRLGQNRWLGSVSTGSPCQSGKPHAENQRGRRYDDHVLAQKVAIGSISTTLGIVFFAAPS